MTRTLDITRKARTNLANPKALLFYGSVFAALVAPGLPGWARAAAVAIVTVDSALWHVALACFFSTPAAQAWYRRAKPAIDRGAALALSAFAITLVLA
jgi:threonine efflux protein